jgi:hypothetical protein
MAQPIDLREMDKTSSQPALVNSSSLVNNVKGFFTKHWLGLLVLGFVLWLVFFGGTKQMQNMVNYGMTSSNGLDNMVMDNMGDMGDTFDLSSGPDLGNDLKALLRSSYH